MKIATIGGGQENSSQAKACGYDYPGRRQMSWDGYHYDFVQMLTAGESTYIARRLRRITDEGLLGWRFPGVNAGLYGGREPAAPRSQARNA